MNARDVTACAKQTDQLDSRQILPFIRLIMNADVGIEDLLSAHRGLHEIISSFSAEDNDGDGIVDVTILSEGLNRSLSSQVFNLGLTVSFMGNEKVVMYFRENVYKSFMSTTVHCPLPVGNLYHICILVR